MLSDQQLQDASFEKLQDLIARVDLLLSKGQPGLSLHPQKMSVSSQTALSLRPARPRYYQHRVELPLARERREGQRSRVRVTSLALPHD